ncbi:MAG: ABC transporter substrate-binding protein [Azospirillaceae bacterium]
MNELFRNGMAAAVAFGLALTGGIASAQEPRHGGTLAYGIESEIPWMDPHVVFGGSNKRVVMMAFEGLVGRDRSDPDRTPPLVGVLAESWEVLEDGRVYRFHLRDGVLFHDGTPFDAEAVRFNFRRIIDPEFEYYYARTEPLKAGPLRRLTDVRVIDEHTVELVLDQPWGPFLDQLSTTLSSGLPLMLSPAAVREHGNEGVNLHPVGTGPFEITRYGPGISTVLERNETYWQAPYPYLDQVAFVVLPEAATRLAALEAGSVDMITAIPADRIASLEDAGFQIVMPDAMNLVWFISLNVAEPPLDDPRVRRAINYAIDRDGIANDLLGGTVAKIGSMIPGTSPLADSDLTARYTYDPDRARELMAEAGHVDGFTTTAQLPTGGSYMLDPVAIMQWVQRDLAEIGITISLETYDWVTYLEYWINGLAEGVGMNVMAWGTDYSEWWLNDIVLSDGFGNTGHVEDEAVDSLFAEYEAAVDPDAALEVAHDILERVTEQAYFVPIASDRAAIAAAPEVRGLEPIPDWMQDFKYYWIAE